MLENRTLSDSNTNAKNIETIINIINNMNKKRNFETLFVPTHLTDFPLKPNYVRGFIEGDG